MRIEDLKRWHWIVIGALVGLLLAYSQLQIDWTGSDRRRTLVQHDFERLLPQKTRDDKRMLEGIRVYQQDDGRYLVALSRLTDRRQGTYGDYKFVAKTPYVPLDKNFPTTPDMTVLDYLAEVRKKHEHVSYAFAWWTAPKWVWTLWTGGSILVIGGIWPTVVSLLAGAGFGRPPRQEPEYDLDRFKGEPEEETKKPAVVSADDQKQLAALEAELERNLASSGAALESNASTPADNAQPQIKKLTGGPVEASSAAQQPEEPKDYRGEFYPVARKH